MKTAVIYAIDVAFFVWGLYATYLAVQCVILSVRLIRNARRST
jgi:hypothetical protein